ncbi:DUF4912 domain-containing protein [Phormidium tenue FACHB-886]|nr:DUF4912 domain-containing protein [Phormidium tenue FACHB-886]
MKKYREQGTLAVLVLLLAIATTPKPVAAKLVLAQAVFPAPASVPQGTAVKIDGSTSMTAINQALSDRFQSQFPGTQVTANYAGTDAALQAVLDGKTDLAAIGRSLTEAEKARGLVELPVARHRIAVIVGANNPFASSLTGEQFASMFRGEVTNWSQVGGGALPLRFIDRPDSSETRSALSKYPVFQAAPFQAGANVVKLDADSTEAVIQQLGNDGISYAIVDQVANNPAVRVLPLYGTLPTDPTYPFSQPLSYVYNGANPSPAAQAFLGFANAPDNQSILESARVAAATSTVPAVPDAPAASPSAAAPTDPQDTAGIAPSAEPAAVGADGGLFSRWWWLLPVLGSLGVLAWLLRKRPEPNTAVEDEAMLPLGDLGEVSAPLAGETVGSTGMAATAPVGTALGAAVAPLTLQKSQIVLTPRNCREAYADWEVADAHKTLLKQQGGRQLVLRLYDVTNIDLYFQAPHSVHEFICGENDQELQISIPTDNRDYVVELGYTTADHRWLPLARSPHVHVPACTAADAAQPNGSQRPSSSFTPVSGGPSPVGLTNQPAGATGETGHDQTTRSSPALSDTTQASADVPAETTANRSPANDRPTSRLGLVPRSAQELYAYWEIPETQKQALQQGAERLILRLYDITGVDLSNQPPRSVQQFECDPDAHDRHIHVATYGDYIATLGYLTEGGRWLLLARSTPVRIRAANQAPSLPPDRG